MLLGVVLHAAVSYMPHAMPDLVWVARDPQRQPLFDWIFWSIHSCRLPLFFALAGFFSVGLYESRGARGYLLHRTRRLLVPFLLGGIVVLPLTFGVWTLGWLCTVPGSIGTFHHVSVHRAFQTFGIGSAHLWFLEYLYGMCLVFAGVCWLRRWFPIPGQGSDRWLASSWLPLVPAVPAAVLLWFDLGAIYGFRQSFAPEPARFAYYGIFFLAGTWLARVRSQLDRYLVPLSGVRLLLCLPLLVVNGVLVQLYLERGLDHLGRMALAASAALLASLALFGFLGLALRFGRRERPLLQFLADASYWVYLIHFPLVGLAQLVLVGVPAPAMVKFLLVTSLVLAFGLWTYQRWVRTTIVGQLLNGTRRAAGASQRPVMGPSVAAASRLSLPEPTTTRVR
jgi:peptidoglycan/LPS O-acetylase OafA/YrhL